MKHLFMYCTDFIHLSSFLFDEFQGAKIDYSKQSTRDRIISIIADSDNIEDIKKSLLPTSNWDRFFSEYIHLPENFQEEWTYLYNIRC
ncbi:hypothetical protein MsAc7_00060 [Methanolapillus millepedarum]|uniref:Uncharacterized protein n=1 Tax=Methanolapillus millepedarum TaxID=3028296 RepID=A0AA96ZTG2_9EURY|nr:hypothetical protein MsAc7_00060 [Methanosarcinaceae archaeon Ac7]